MSCNMGVGCDEYGVCYAMAQGQPELCCAGDGKVGWVQVMDDLLICSHLGVANVADTYKTARGKAMSLIALEVDIACNPAVNGGKVLVNQGQVKSLLTYFAQGQMPKGVRECLNQTLEELQ